METFKVVVQGRCIGGFSSEAVKAGLAKLMRVTETVAEQLLQGQETTVKKGVDQQTGEQYLTALRTFGVECRLESERPALEISASVDPSFTPSGVEIQRQAEAKLSPVPKATDLPASPSKRATTAMLLGLFALLVVSGAVFLSRFDTHGNSDAASNAQSKSSTRMQSAANLEMSTASVTATASLAEVVQPLGSTSMDAGRPAANLKLPQFLSCSSQNPDNFGSADLHYFDTSGRYAGWSAPTVEGKPQIAMGEHYLGRWSHQGRILRIIRHAKPPPDAGKEAYQLLITATRLSGTPEGDAASSRLQAIKRKIMWSPTFVMIPPDESTYDVAISKADLGFISLDNGMGGVVETCSLPNKTAFLDLLRANGTEMAESMFGPGIVTTQQSSTSPISGSRTTAPAPPPTLQSNANYSLEQKAMLTSLVGQHPGKSMGSPTLKAKLQSILNDEYSRLADRIDVSPPLQNRGGYLFGSGCMPHQCTVEEGAYAVNIETGATYAAILSSGSIKVFGAQSSALPPPLRQWHRDHGGND